MKTVILGIGHWHAAWYVDSLRTLGCAVTGVWDHDTDTASRVGRSIDARSYTSYQEALAAESPELVVALPRPVDAQAVMREAVELGVPIIAEKPLGLNADDVKAIAELAEEYGTFVSVMFPNRLSAMWQHALAARSGEVIGAYFRINNGPYRRYVSDGSPWMLVASEAGGGVLRNLGIHATDAVQMLARGQGVEVLGVSMAKADATLEIETYCVALLRFGNATAVIDVGYNQPDDAASDTEWRISTSGVYLSDRDEKVSVRDVTGEHLVDSVPFASRYHRAVETALRNFEAGAAPLASVWDCYRAARLVDEIYEHAGPQWAAHSLSSGASA